jgi:hypothetical protein
MVFELNFVMLLMSQSQGLVSFRNRNGPARPSAAGRTQPPGWARAGGLQRERVLALMSTKALLIKSLIQAN